MLFDQAEAGAVPCVALGRAAIAETATARVGVLAAAWGVPLGITLLKVGGFIAFMLIVARRAVPWLLHYVAHTGSRELFTQVEFEANVLRDISKINLETTILGGPSSLPVALAPTSAPLAPKGAASHDRAHP